LNIAVETQTGSGSTEMSMESASPRIFTLGGGGQAQGIVSFQDTSDLAMPRNFRVPAHPAQPGDDVLIWATGLGLTNSDNTAQISATMGGVDAEVEAVKAVLGYAGVYTVQVRVPMVPNFGDNVPLQVRVVSGNNTPVASNIATLSVEPAQQ
jgi:uncharacterized protein (TIGR03437 family)